MSIIGIKKIYSDKKEEIKFRLEEFKQKLKIGDEKDIFAELVFCILTPQSKAKVCWTAVEKLLEKNLLVNGSSTKILKELDGVRFKYKKAEYIVNAREFFIDNGDIFIKSSIRQFNDILETREWFVKNVKGIGFKESSHFLRNIGLGDNLAILDRHILKNLKLLGVINEIPKSLTKLKYYEIEGKMKKFADRINIPMNYLDLLLWYKEAGEVFK